MSDKDTQLTTAGASGGPTSAGDSNNSYAGGGSSEKKAIQKNNTIDGKGSTDNNGATQRGGALLAVRVKPEHVSSERPACLAPLPPADPPRTEGERQYNDNRNSGNKSNNNKRNRNRGQNKKRPRDAQIDNSQKACLAVIRGEVCPFETADRKCRYNHDLKEMLADRPPDICHVVGGAVWLKEEGCPVWNAKGYCDFGIMCRLGSSHVNMSTGQNLRRAVDGDGKETIVEPPSSSSGVSGTATDKADGVVMVENVQVEVENNDDGAKSEVVKVEAENTSDEVAAEDAIVNTENNGDVTTTEAENVKVESNTGNDAVLIKPKPGTLLGHHEGIKNVLSKETQIKLRKNKYPFVCKRHYELPKKGKNNKQQQQSAPPLAKSTVADKPALPPRERKLIDFRNKVYVAPLTTVGNLPFRRVMKYYGADITCGEMALADQLLSGKPSEWALLKRHPSEDVYGVQIASGHADQYTRIAEVLANEPEFEVDFVDMNLGCPIDLVCEKGAGASLMMRDKKLRGSLEGMLKVLDCPVTIKMRTGWSEGQPIAHELMPKIQGWGIDGIGAFMIHGRSRLQRYSRLANYEYVYKVAGSQSPSLPRIPLIGNGDIFSYTDYEEKILGRVGDGDGDDTNNMLSPTAMLGRGALIKPWLPTEIKERRHWDISATERLDMLKDFVRFGLEHWGSDQQGVNRVRRFLLEWLSFLHRYVPVGMLEVVPQQMNHRPPNNMCGRSDLETMMLSKNCADWIKISEMLLGPVPEDFMFEPKHKANSYQRA
mmetsp:Transcript_640/g.1473  ORF Transcript_640/g.1473 Transcript_640/m.1473 type:complete len:769 (+) Transcript_640:66-2372(+)